MSTSVKTYDEAETVRDDQPTSPAERRADVDRAQLLKDADTLMVLVLEHIEPDDYEVMQRHHPLLWSIRQALLQSSDREVQRFNAVLGLSVVVQYPDFL